MLNPQPAPIEETYAGPSKQEMAVVALVLLAATAAVFVQKLIMNQQKLSLILSLQGLFFKLQWIFLSPSLKTFFLSPSSLNIIELQFSECAAEPSNYVFGSKSLDCVYKPKTPDGLLDSGTPVSPPVPESPVLMLSSSCQQQATALSGSFKQQATATSSDCQQQTSFPSIGCKQQATVPCSGYQKQATVPAHRVLHTDPAIWCLIWWCTGRHISGSYIHRGFLEESWSSRGCSGEHALVSWHNREC